MRDCQSYPCLQQAHEIQLCQVLKVLSGRRLPCHLPNSTRHVKFKHNINAWILKCGSHDLVRHLLVERVEICENDMHRSMERFPYMERHISVSPLEK